MKRLLLFSMMCLMALSMHAQRCAVLDFQVGTGVTEEEIDGISYNFRVNFRPSGYTLLERGQINRIIKEQNYNRTDMTLQQMLRVGRNLDASIILVGTMNKFMDEYSVDIRIINVATGTTTVTEAATFEKTAYRNSMEKLATKLASKLASQSSSSIGTTRFSSSIAQGYVDLGLPSGTLWKATNEGGLYDYDAALNQFGSSLPSKEQWEELKNYCTWIWISDGYKVLGSNGNYIVLPAPGYLGINDRMYRVGSIGHYWSSTPYGINGAWMFYFYVDDKSGREIGLDNEAYRNNKTFIRLVQNL